MPGQGRGERGCPTHITVPARGGIPACSVPLWPPWTMSMPHAQALAAPQVCDRLPPPPPSICADFSGGSDLPRLWFCLPVEREDAPKLGSLQKGVQRLGVISTVRPTSGKTGPIPSRLTLVNLALFFPGAKSGACRGEVATGSWILRRAWGNLVCRCCHFYRADTSHSQGQAPTWCRCPQSCRVPCTLSLRSSTVGSCPLGHLQVPGRA